MAKSKHSIRVISGSLRGRKIPVLDIPGLRPSGDRSREVLFNWLQFDMPGMNVLDLFAGTGALGIEAISRGAKSATIIEKDKKAFLQLHRIIGDFNLKYTEVKNISAQDYLAKNRKAFDLVFLDPPFHLGLLESIIPAIESIVTQDGYVYCELDKDQSSNYFSSNFELIRQKKLGQVKIELWQNKTANPQNE